METKATMCAAVHEVLDKDNYVDWSVQVKTYLMAQDLWDVVKATTEHPKLEADEATIKAWGKKNSMSLHVILISCGSDAFSKIRGITSAKDAWDTLEGKYAPKNTGMDNNESNDYGEYVALCKALRSGDLNDAREFFMLRPNAVNAKITILGQTALHIAVVAKHLHIVEELVELMWEEALEIKDYKGNTALFEALFIGNCGMAKCILSKNKKLVSIGNASNILPVVMAIQFGYTELARELYVLTPLEDLTPEKGDHGATLCTQATYNRSLDIALDLIQHCPRLTLALDRLGCSPLYALSDMPNAFPSGDRLVFWKRWIYKYCIHIQPASAIKEIRLNIQNVEKCQSHKVKIIKSGQALFRQLVSNLLNFLGIKDLYEMKLVHVQSHELLDCMCKEVSTGRSSSVTNINKAIFRSIERGNFKFIFRIVKAKPILQWSRGEDQMSIFSFAVLHRQEKIFSLIYGLALKKNMTTWIDNKGNCILHMAGMTSPLIQLNRIQGAALQMQRELQWFKEVESIVAPRFKEFSNKDGLTPRELFTKNHKDLKKEGESWMKGTATSCTVVGALIVTIMFAAAFTVPGGNKQDGYPVFLDEKLFMVFIISDALSLFSSSTSVLMFLGILTSRYAEDDFLESLPRKMIIGLSTLFFSIAAMMIAFSTALLIMLHGQSWIVIPIVCLASVPVTLFVLMQFPLLVDMFISTYGRGIFDKKMERWV